MTERPVATTSPETMRAWNLNLGLWALCDNTACRRARFCRGDVYACAPRNFARLPEGVKESFACLVVSDAQGLTFEEAFAWLESMPCSDVLKAWHAKIGDGRFDLVGAPPATARKPQRTA
jgi:hypothetical protein